MIGLTSVLDHDSEIGVTDLLAYVLKQLLSAGPLKEPMGHTGQHGIQPLWLKWCDRTSLNTLFQEQVVHLQEECGGKSKKTELNEKIHHVKNRG